MNVRRRLAAAAGLLAGAGLSLGLLLSGALAAAPAAAAAAPPPQVCVGTSNGQGWDAYCLTLPAL